MTGAETLDVARDAIWTIVVVSSPLMVVGLVPRATSLLRLMPLGLNLLLQKFYQANGRNK